MESITLKEELTFSVPDGFEKMPDEDRSKMNFLMNGPGVCFTDPVRHILLSIGWKEADLLLAVLIRAKDLVKRMEKDVQASMKEYGYRGEGMRMTRIGGKKAYGIRYRYKAQDVNMVGDSYVMQYKKTYYYFHCYMREELEKDSVPVWEEILSSVKLP